jgi:cytochrome c oxidase subunit 4
MGAAVQTYEEKKSLYMKVFWALLVITVVELAVARSHFIPHVLKVFGVVSLSLTKAIVVAWIYMHLNHETRWTKIVAACPVIVLIYVAALVYDSGTDPLRKNSVYIGEPSRVLAPGHDPAKRHAEEEAAHSAELDENFPDAQRKELHSESSAEAAHNDSGEAVEAPTKEESYE